MKQDKRISSLSSLLSRLLGAGKEHERVSIKTMLHVVGQQSFGPLLLLEGIIVFSPLSGIPGVPTMVALLVLLTAGQLLFGRKHFWLPQWLLRRSISSSKLQKALHAIQPPARFIDRLFRPRLTVLTRRAGVLAVATVCVLIALIMPLLELIPFASTSAGAAFTAFGLSLLSQDGLMTLIAMIFTCATAAVVIHAVL